MSNADYPSERYSAEEKALLAEYRDKPFPELKNDLVLRAAKGLKVERAPVWLHRQAGRYLPEFLAVRKNHGFFDVCRTPSLACEVTLQPIDRFPDLDASIIFSDILVVPQALGLEVKMLDSEGPVFPAPLRSPADLSRVAKSDVPKSLGYVYDAIMLTRHKLGGRVPLIGFCGGPWTLMAYMTDGGGKGSKTFQHSKSWLLKYPKESHELLQLITDVCVEFLVGQAEAGAQMLQVFESSAGELSPPMFEEFALPYLAQIPARVRAALREKSVTSSVTKHGVIDATAPDVDDTDIPITCFPRCAHHALSLLAGLQYDTLSLDWTIVPSVARAQVASPAVSANPAVAKYTKPNVPTTAAKSEGKSDDAVTAGVTADWRKQVHSVTLQGSLDPGCLFAPDEELKRRTAEMVGLFGTQRYIANLGHGMLPAHEPRAVATFTRAVHEASTVAKL